MKQLLSYAYKVSEDLNYTYLVYHKPDIMFTAFDLLFIFSDYFLIKFDRSALSFKWSFDRLGYA